jgi:hypothetical protein
MPRQRLKTLLAPALAALLLLTAGCLSDLSHREMADLERMPQNPLVYLDPPAARQPLIASEEQQSRAADFLERYFAAWHAGEPLESTRRPFWAVDWVGENPVFGENLRPAEPERLRELIRQADPESYPSLDRWAITARRVDLRALPTQRPLFNDPREAGEGFPFDLLQHAALAANTPVHVTHQSEDGTWLFVETSLIYGWIPATDLAGVDDEFIRAFESGRYLALTRDDVAVFDAEGIYRFRAGMGSLLPVIGTGNGGHRVLLAVADKDRKAHLAETTISFDRGEIFPLPLTPCRLASLASRMVGQPYGWGESLADRDCSATVRDLFAPFGLWLPRNSSGQSRVGTVIPLSDLTPGEREKRLLEEGIPFLTLVRTPGHIMLYIGEREGRAAVLHTLWGLRTRSLSGREGRWIVGRTVITSLEPGRERDGLFLGVGNLLGRVESMNILELSGGLGDLPEESHP